MAQATYPRAARNRLWSEPRHAYLVLLPVRFTWPRTVTSRAVGSYPTVSPLPWFDAPCSGLLAFAMERRFAGSWLREHLFASPVTARKGGLFLWHCLSACAGRALPATVSRGARTFLGSFCLLRGLMANAYILYAFTEASKTHLLRWRHSPPRQPISPQPSGHLVS